MGSYISYYFGARPPPQAETVSEEQTSVEEISNADKTETDSNPKSEVRDTDDEVPNGPGDTSSNIRIVDDVQIKNCSETLIEIPLSHNEPSLDRMSEFSEDDLRPSSSKQQGVHSSVVYLGGDGSLEVKPQVIDKSRDVIRLIASIEDEDEEEEEEYDEE